MKIGGVAGPMAINEAISRYQTNTAFKATRDSAGLPSVGATRVGEPVPSVSDIKFGTHGANDKMSAVTLDISDQAKAMNKALVPGLIESNHLKYGE